jgi:hypothetical protein
MSDMAGQSFPFVGVLLLALASSIAGQAPGYESPQVYPSRMIIHGSLSA